jgi:hypothetical protein
MLSLAGEMEIDVDIGDDLLGPANATAGSSSSRPKGHYRMKMLDSEMDDFLAD